MLKQGIVIDGKYEVLEVIGQGGMGRVYKVRHVNLGTIWAVKEVIQTSGESVDLLAEPNILRKLNHPGLPRIIDIFQMDHCLYIVEDYIEGIPLDKMLKQRKAFPQDMVMNWGEQLCDILYYLHTRKPNPIIYRDMKPGNIIVGNDGVVKLIDFGIAREYNKNKSSDTVYMGTKGYAAPEQYGIGQTDERTDIYSLGVTLYTLVTGHNPSHPPYEIRPIRQWNENLSATLEAIILKCIQLNPENRFQSVPELKQALESVKEFDEQLKHSKKKIVIRNVIIGAILFGLINGAVLAYGEVQKHNKNAYFQLVNQGIEYSRNNKWIHAEALFKQAIEKNHKESEAYEHLCNVYLSQGKYEKVLKQISDIKKQSDFIMNQELYYIYATALFQLKHYDEAIRQYKLALHLDKDYTEAARGLSVALVRNGDFEAAESILTDIDEQDDFYYYLKAEMSFYNNHYPDAESNMIKAIDMNHEVEHYYIFLSEIYQKMNDEKRQIAILEKAMQELPDVNKPKLLELTGDAYQKAAENEEDKNVYLQKSLQSYMKILDMGFETTSLHLKAGRACRLLGDLMKAEEHYEKALQIDKDCGLAYIQLGYLAIEKENARHTKVKNYDKAVLYLQAGMNMIPVDSPDYWQAQQILNQLQKGE